MSKVTIAPGSLEGSVAAPPSKSFAQRAMIASFLSGNGTVTMHGTAEDIVAMKNALDALQSNASVIDCGESGATLRLLVPLAAALGKNVTFTGRGRLPERPIGEYLRLLPAHGIRCEYNGSLPLTISGQLQPGSFAVSGNVTSQYISGLLMSLPLLKGDSEIRLTTPLQSEPYVAMTLQVLQDSGVRVEPTADGFDIPGGQRYQARDFTVEGDWSQAAFFLAAGALNGDTSVIGLNPDSVQGDKEIVSVLRRFGADITVGPNGVHAVKSPLKGISVDVTQIPDTVPVIAALAAYAEGTTMITGAERLRFKESDRLAALVQNLQKAGITAKETPDGMRISGGQPHGAVLQGCHDHRVVMAMSVLALAADGETTISDADSVSKSYPAFFNDYQSLGGYAHVVDDRQ